MLCSPGYESDERSSLGKRGERRLWREERPERSAAVYGYFKSAAENEGNGAEIDGEVICFGR